MVCTVVAGGLWGDEGKGKIVSYLAVKDKLELCIRTGSVDAAHMVVHEGKKTALHMVPSAFVHPECRLLIGAGANIKVDLLLDEIKATQTKRRIGVDPQCSIIEDEHALRDKTDTHLKEKIQTTGWGVGPANEDRVRRVARLARDIPELHDFLADVALEANSAIDAGKRVLIEGVHGLFLSLYHGTYPYVTPRDATAASTCSEAGIGPKKVDKVLIVYKSFMTRVGAGPLPGQLPREETEKRGWLEYGSGTGRERRSAPLDLKLAKRAAVINSATEAALTKFDTVFPSCYGMSSFDELPKDAKKFVREFEDQVGIPVTLIGTGPEVQSVIDRRNGS